jgi:hypothetical protein
MEGSGRSVIQGFFPGICLEALMKTTKTLVRISGFRAEIWTWDLPNTKQTCWPPQAVSSTHYGPMSFKNVPHNFSSGSLIPRIFRSTKAPVYHRGSMGGSFSFNKQDYHEGRRCIMESKKSTSSSLSSRPSGLFCLQEFLNWKLHN